MTRTTRRAVDGPRRGLNHLQAALYVGVSPNKFTELMDAGRMAQPRLIDGQRVWDVDELDIYFDSLPHDNRPAHQRARAHRRPGQIDPV